jgi:hypothetical protein
MALPDPESEEYEVMIALMRDDLESGMEAIEKSHNIVEIDVRDYWKKFERYNEIFDI